ncbi:MAG TPA: hypothetical protein PLH67_11730, partial [Lentisphaeria bacterium]|nr:hypothetical protein [Lentisphaeria bacterium]
LGSRRRLIKVLLQISTYVSPLWGSKIIIHLTQGFATLTLGFYVSALRAFCPFTAVDLVDGVDIVDGGCLKHFSASPDLPRPTGAVKETNRLKSKSSCNPIRQGNNPVKNPCPSVSIRG